MYTKEFILKEVNTIRDEIGHDKVNIFIEELYFNETTNELWIITEDRPDKSAIIGKGGWVVGKLREKLGLESIHVESYGDFLNKNYKLKLSKKTINNLNSDLIGLKNLQQAIEDKLANIYSFNFENYLNENEFEKAQNTEAVVALSGGVDSSFSLILAKKLGFNPIAVTVDPGTIILPKQFKNNIEKLCSALDVSHEYIKTDYSDVVEESFTGNVHPCGRCSKNTGELVKEYAKSNGGSKVYRDSTGTIKLESSATDAEANVFNFMYESYCTTEEVCELLKEYYRSKDPAVAYGITDSSYYEYIEGRITFQLLDNIDYVLNITALP